jgi:hypothetical protein
MYAASCVQSATMSAAVSASGTKLFFNDDQQFPDTQYVVFDYPGDGKVGNRRQLAVSLTPDARDCARGLGAGGGGAAQPRPPPPRLLNEGPPRQKPR